MSENTSEESTNERQLSSPDLVAHRPDFPRMTENEQIDLEDEVEERNGVEVEDTL